MSRNGSGTQTTPNSFTAGTTITASDHNENWADAAAEITNSVAVDGQSTMTGPLKAASGTVAAPGVTFGADTDSGLYRIGANNVGLAVNGAKVLDVATTGLAVTGTFAATGVISQNGARLLPIGLGPLPWPGTTAPSLWVLAGATYSRTTYADLWAFAEAQIALGNVFFTNGDGSTTFTIATMDGYAPVGVDAAAARIASFTDVGDTAGAATVTLTTTEMPVHSHGVTDPGHTHTQQVTNAAGASTSVAADIASGATGAVQSTVSNTTGISIQNAGSGAAHANVQPSRAFKFIIFAGV